MSSHGFTKSDNAVPRDLAEIGFIFTTINTYYLISYFNIPNIFGSLLIDRWMDRILFICTQTT